MKRILATVLAFLFVSVIRPFAVASDESGWSTPVNGLQARLSFARTQPLNGTPLVTTYLELRNVSDAANVMEVPLKVEAIQFQVVDEQNQHVAPTRGPFDELAVELGMLRLPHDSYLRFNISHHGAGVPKDQSALLDLGLLQSWVFGRGDKRSYYLCGRFSVEKSKDRIWSGMIEIPKAKIPTAE
jgi:hypothetical protein